MCPRTEFPVLKTIKLGTHKSLWDLRQSIEAGGNRIGAWGDSILSRIILSTFETEVTLHVASVSELTGRDFANIREVITAVQALGYDLCPGEIGPQLRRQYSEQPEDDWLNIAMEPVLDSCSDLLGIFSVARFCCDEHWLLGSGGGHREWDGDARFVFSSYSFRAGRA